MDLKIGLRLISDDIKDTKLKILEDCYPKPKNIKQISQDLNINYRAIHRHVTDLQKKGYLKVSKPDKDARGKPRVVELTEKVSLIIQGLKK